MNFLINDSSYNHKNIENLNKRVNQIKKLINNGYYFQSNINNKFSSRNSIDNKGKTTTNFYKDKIKNNFYSKSYNHLDISNKKNIINYKKYYDNNINNNNNIKLNKNKINQLLIKKNENQYIFSLAMSNLNKYKDNLITKKDINQINMNYCIMNQNCKNNKININNNIYKYNNENDEKENFNPNYEISKNNYEYNYNNNNNENNNNNNENNELINEKGDLFPLPYPTPIKVNKSSKYINQKKNSSYNLNKNILKKNSSNYFNKNYYNKFFNQNDMNNIIPNNVNSLNNEIINDDYHFGNSLNSFYNKAFNTERDKMVQNKLSEKNLLINNGNYNNTVVNNEDEYKLIYILKNLNLSYLIDSFRINYINFSDLFLLTKEDFVEMKIPIGPRNKILNFIQEYKKYMKNLEMEELSNFFNINKNKLSQGVNPQFQISENLLSTMPTTNNEFSNRIKEKSNNIDIIYNNAFSIGKIEEPIKKIKSDRDITSYNLKVKENNNYNSSNSLLSSSYNNKKDIFKRNSSCLKNLKANSYFNSNNNLFNYYKNNSVINKKKLSNSSITNDNKCSKNKNIIHSYKYISINNNKYNLKENTENTSINSSILNKMRTRSNNKYYFRNPLTTLIENTNTNTNNNTNKSFSIIEEQTLKGVNSSIRRNVDEPHKNENTINIKNNTKNLNRNIFKKSNKNIKNNKTNLNNIQSINNKIFENYKSLNNEVESFQNQYKKMKKESYDRENKIKNLLLGEKHSKEKIKSLKQHMKNLDYFKSDDLKNEYIRDLNTELAKKIFNKNLVYRNICQNKSNNNNIYNITGNKKNILLYELDIENNS